MPAEMTSEIPVIDVSGVLAGTAGALEAAAAELRHAYEDVGFWYMKGHGIDPSLIDATFAAAQWFHQLPLAQKMGLKANIHNVGYLPFKGSTTRHSTLNENNKPNLSEGFILKRDLPADHPDVLAGVLYRSQNQWPEGAPEFRATCVAYANALEKLALAMLPIYAVALDLPADWFTHAFVEPQYTLRLMHYTAQPKASDNEFGLAPHIDTAFMTLLAPNATAGLEIQTQSKRWISAPPIKDAFIVNSGELLRRWTNDRFFATPHRVINLSGGERYAIPFFFDTTLRYEMNCLPSCIQPGEAPRYEPISYLTYQQWFQNQNYDHIRESRAAQATAQSA